MDETQLRLDGNATAGLLDEIFVAEVTSALGACAGCGAVAQMGAQHLYMAALAPGAVVRCHACEGVLMVIVRREGRVRLGVPGLAWIEVAEPAGAA